MRSSPYRNVRLVIQFLGAVGFAVAVGIGGFVFSYLSSVYVSPKGQGASLLAGIFAAFIAFVPFGFVAECYKIIHDIAVNTAETNVLLKILIARQPGEDRDAAALAALREQAP